MKQMIMVVEDDHMLRGLIKIYLERAGYDVVEAADGEAAKNTFLKHSPCLVILDLMLPKVSGEEICTWIREDLKNSDVSIIMLTAKSQTTDKIKGLRMGADHYVTKPFNPDELIAHVEALLRRTGKYCQKVTIDGLSIMPRKAKVLLYDQEISLTKIEFQLLYLFMTNPGVVFTREQLMDELYSAGEKDILDRTIDAHIKKLREKIEKIPSQPERILTRRGMGYLFVQK